jgi:Protein of unknown function (DUF2846)
MTGPLRVALIAAIALAAAGCASTPQASRASDAEAKEFRPDPRSATLYVYRNDWPNEDAGEQSDSVLYVDQRLIGSTLPGIFFVVRLRAGVHTLSGIAQDQGHLTVEVRAGQLYFVSLNVVGGDSLFRRVPVDAGKSEVLACCDLLETWAPGQRPFLQL